MTRQPPPPASSYLPPSSRLQSPCLQGPDYVATKLCLCVCVRACVCNVEYIHIGVVFRGGAVFVDTLMSGSLVI